MRGFKEKFERAEGDIFPEAKKKEAIQIKGFEPFDSSGVTGEEIVKQALQFLPKELLGQNIKVIEYDSKVALMAE